MELRQLPRGFRFHPTEEELLGFYLPRLVSGKQHHFKTIGTLNIYRHDPWELPDKAKTGDMEWYFFMPRQLNAANRWRANWKTGRGFWKATGLDWHILSSTHATSVIGVKKRLVNYQGNTCRSTKTDCAMNVYRLPDYTGPD